jgi:adenine-specific DNA methylase
MATTQLVFFHPETKIGKPPSTRYQGSKAKLVTWIWENIRDLDFRTCLDAFGGTGSVAYFLKSQGKQVTFNDYLKFNAISATGLLENTKTELLGDEALSVENRRPGFSYEDLIERTFDDIYFLREENRWLDVVCQNIPKIEDGYKRAIAYHALFQSCIVKRPYNLFHRKNLYMRTAEVKRGFGNKATWDTSFDEHFIRFVKEANEAVFDSGFPCRVLCGDALAVPGDFDLVYIDTPYLNSRGVGVDYLDFYHFLEGMVDYERWAHKIDYRRKHRPLKAERSPWSDPGRIADSFEKVFERFSKSILVVSYRGDGIPSEEDLLKLVKKFKKHVRVAYQEKYKYVLSTNTNSKEVLLVAW